MEKPGKIAVGCDHAGFQLKQHLTDWLAAHNFEYIDFGTHSEASVDYPDFIHPVAQAIERGEAAMGLIMCGSGNGVAMTANKHAHIRAALCWTPELAGLARAHNNANVLALPARFISPGDAEAMLQAFLNTPFEGGRHSTRVDKIAC